jgi:hypothetical protein
VAQQPGLMARLLPDDPDAEVQRILFRLLPPLAIGVNLIGVHQHYLQMELRSPLAAPDDFLFSLSQPGDRVASAGIQVHDFQMDRPSSFAEEVVQDLPIGLLGFTFAAEKDRRSLGDHRAARSHPI